MYYYNINAVALCETTLASYRLSRLWVFILTVINNGSFKVKPVYYCDDRLGGRMFDPRTVQTFVCMKSVCISLGVSMYNMNTRCLVHTLSS
jgi:hypothetical protein